MAKRALMTKQHRLLHLARVLLDARCQCPIFVVFVVLVCVLAGRQGHSHITHGRAGQVFLSGAAVLGCTTFVLVVSLKFCEWQCKRGATTMATALLLPVYEPVLWLILNFSALFFVVFLALNVSLEGWQKGVGSGFSLLAVGIAGNFVAFWIVWALFRCESLSFPAVVRSIAMAGVGATAQALVNSLESVVFVMTNGTERAVYSTLVVLAGRVLVMLALYGPMVVHRNRSRNASVVLFGIFCIISPTVYSVVMLVAVNTGHFSGTIVDVYAVLYLVFTSVFTFVLYRALWLDTQYWRGVSRKPLWCQDAPESPYGAISNNIITTQLPLLLESPVVPCVDFAFVSFGKFIGAGATARVFQGEITGGALKGKRVAIKAFTPMELTEESLEEFREEAVRASSLTHPNIAQSYGICVCPPDICMLTEFCENGSLDSFLQTHPNLPTHTRFRLACQAAKAIAFLHSRSVVHRDIKAENFLVDGAGDCKLTDFGTSRVVEDDDDNDYDALGNPSRRRMTINVGSACWMSPEILQRRDDYGTPSDVYSLAVVLWEIWCQSRPYPDKNTGAEIFAFVLAGNRLDIPEDCPPAYRALIEEAWRDDPAQRPTAHEIAERLQSMC